MFSRFIHVTVCIRTCSFIFSSNIPLYGYITFYLWIHQLLDNDLFPLWVYYKCCCCKYSCTLLSTQCVAMPVLSCCPCGSALVHTLGSRSRLHHCSFIQPLLTLSSPPQTCSSSKAHYRFHHLSCCTTQKLSHRPVCYSQPFHPPPHCSPHPAHLPLK